MHIIGLYNSQGENVKLTNFTDYSMRALIYLAVHPGRLCTVKEISEAFNISQNHMVKVVHSLSKHRYINTKKGKNGGIELSKPAYHLNVGDIVRTLESDLYIVECFNSDDKRCSITAVCKLKHVLFNAYKAFIGELDKHTLADITENMDELLEVFEIDNA